METVTAVVGAAALVVTAVTVIPQTLRILRRGSTAGVSPVWAMLGVVSTGAWTAYTAARGLWWATVADALSCVSYLSSVHALARHGESPRFTAGLAWLTVFVTAFLVAGLAGVGTVLAVAFVIQVAPSIWVAYRRTELQGASTATWFLTTSEGLLWLVYGLAEGDPAVIAFGVVATLAGTLMVGRIRWTSRLHPDSV